MYIYIYVSFVYISKSLCFLSHSSSRPDRLDEEGFKSAACSSYEERQALDIDMSCICFFFIKILFVFIICFVFLFFFLFLFFSLLIHYCFLFFSICYHICIIVLYCSILTYTLSTTNIMSKCSKSFGTHMDLQKFSL